MTQIFAAEKDLRSDSALIRRFPIHACRGADWHFPDIVRNLWSCRSTGLAVGGLAMETPQEGTEPRAALIEAAWSGDLELNNSHQTASGGR